MPQKQNRLDEILTKFRRGDMLDEFAHAEVAQEARQAIIQWAKECVTAPTDSPAFLTAEAALAWAIGFDECIKITLKNIEEG